MTTLQKMKSTRMAPYIGLMQQLTPEEKRIVVMFLTEMGDESKQDVVDRVHKKYGVAESEGTRWFREHAQTTNEWDGKQAWGQLTEQQRAETARLHLTEEDMDERTVAMIKKHLSADYKSV